MGKRGSEGGLRAGDTVMSFRPELDLRSSTKPQHRTNYERHRSRPLILRGGRSRIAHNCNKGGQPRY